MQVALICGKCNKVHTEETDGANLVIDFSKRQFGFICMNKQCKHDNIFDFAEWSEKSKRSALPRMRTI